MDLNHDFYRLPIRFDSERLAAEVAGFSEDDWRPHPQGFEGNSALLLISARGSLEDDGLKGPQEPTPLLQRCPYLQQVLSSFDTVLGRTRLMRLAPHADAKAHMDASYYWHQRVRIHVPIQTHPDISFHAGDSAVHMEAGDCWIFNTWKMHTVKNATDQTRIHLVADTVGSGALWDLVENADPTPAGKTAKNKKSRHFIAFRENAEPVIATEGVNFPVVMSPWEQQSLLTPILRDLRSQKGKTAKIFPEIANILLRFRRQWHNTWALHGEQPAGWPAFKNTLEHLQTALQPFKGNMYLQNGMEAIGMIEQAVVAPALNPEMQKEPQRARVGAPAHTAAITKPQAEAQAEPPPTATANRVASQAGTQPFDRPVIIVSAPRSGSSFLFETLSRSPGFYTIGGESHGIFESIPKLQPANRIFESNRLTDQDADSETCDIIRRSFYQRLRSNSGTRPPRNRRIRLLEKTPKNALRIPFLNTMFPDALFIYLYRDPAENISSIKEAWDSGRFVTYENVPGWPRKNWSMLLTPGWRELADAGSFEIALAQWQVCNQQIMADLGKIPEERWTAISYAELLEDTRASMARLCRFVGVIWEDDLKDPLPLSKHTVSAPQPDKWRQHEAEITALLPATVATDAQAQAVLAACQTRKYPERLQPDISTDPKRSPMRSSHTTSLTKMLKDMQFSLLVTTYQAGKLIIVRQGKGKLNTHFSMFKKPMGLAANAQKIALGTNNTVEFFVNMAKSGNPEGSAAANDACFMKRLEQVTGNIDIHEMGWGENDLWLVNTRFSCLCTLDLNNNFVPRWRPSFITALAPEDRCHLNGLCIIDGQPKYVTALGQSDQPQGWRDKRASGGIIIDIESNELIASGLSMPHSPRWYRDQMWVLESGKGSLAKVNIKTGEINTLAELPGFTRGLCFVGDYAFVGLSEVRETAAFGSIPITEKVADRTCGVWVVDIRNGNIAGFLRFEGDIREIFAVEALTGITYPDLLQTGDDAINSSFALPQNSLADVATHLRPAKK